MRIHHIKLKNYRQYKDATIDLSLDPVRNFTVIQGANGAGKSNLLNAITWCLYGEERHLRENEGMGQLPIINEKVYHDLGSGERATAEVELALGDEEIEYYVRRRAQAYRRLDNEVSVREDADPVLMYRVRDSWRTSDQPTYAIDALLPRDISHFFLFDGEQLDRFFHEDSTEQVEKGVVNVSQIDLLTQAIEHLESVRNATRRTADGISPEIDSINLETDRLGDELQDHRLTLSCLRQDRQELQENLREIRDQLRTSSVEEVRHLQESREALGERMHDLETELEQLREKAAQTLLNVGPRVYAFSALKVTAELIGERITHGELPPKVRAPFFQDLLDAGRCVCGRDLEEGTPAREAIRQQLERISGMDYESRAIEGRYYLSDLLDGTAQLVRAQWEIGKEIKIVEDQIETYNKEMREISSKIEKIGEVNLEEIDVLEQQHRKFEDELKKIDQQIGRELAEVERLELELEKSNRRLERALQDDKRRQALLARLELITAALSALAEIRTELLSEVRELIEAKTEEYFLNLIWKQETYSRVTINERYQINVLNVRGMPSLGTLSAGERQVLALAFMAALGEVSGFEAPVVIDTPIGRISGEPRKNIAESLPNYLEGTQVTLLMTDTEFSEEVQLSLHSRVGKEYRLDFDEPEAETEVVQVR